MLKLKLQHFGHLIQEIYMLVAQLYPILFNPMDCSLPGSSVHGILHQEYWSGLPFPSPCRDGSLEKTLMLGKIEGRRRREQHRMRWLDGITDYMDTRLSNSGRWWRTEKPGVLQSMRSQRVGHDLMTEQQQKNSLSIWSFMSMRPVVWRSPFICI